MKTLRNRTLFTVDIIALLICCILFVGMAFSGCLSEEERQKRGIGLIKEYTEIEVPIDSKTLFRYADNAFANGRHELLTVFEFENEPTDWLKENKFLRSDDETKNEDGYGTLVGSNKGYFFDYFDIEKIDKKGIPEEYVPDFEIPYLWLRTSNVYFFYYPDTLRRIVYIAWS